jgi:hypothetical protein
VLTLRHVGDASGTLGRQLPPEEKCHQQYLFKVPNGYCGIGGHRCLLPGGRRACGGVNREIFNQVSVLWAEHRGQFCPDDLRDFEINGQPVMLLDLYMAGCLTSYVGSGRGVSPADQFRIVSGPGEVDEYVHQGHDTDCGTRVSLFARCAAKRSGS